MPETTTGPDELAALRPTGVGAAAGTKIGVGTNGLPVMLFVGQATSDGTIVTEVGADTAYADGSLYVSAVDGAGKLFQKQNDIWVDMQA